MNTSAVAQRQIHDQHGERRSELEILHLCNGLDPARDGGMVPSILGMTGSLAGLGSQITIVTPTPSRHDVLKLPSGVLLLGPETSLEDSVRAADVVHMHGLWQQHSRRGARASRISKIPYLIAAHGMADPWALRQKRWKKSMYTAAIEGRNLRDAACLHALTRPEVGHLRRFAPRANVAMVPNGVDLSPYRDLPDRSVFEVAHPELRGKFVLLFFGRVHKKKGLDLLAQAVAAIRSDHPSIHVLVAGLDDGALLPLFSMAEDLGIRDRFTYVGHVSGEEARQVWGAADAFVLPSYSEGFSMAVLEALACRLPVLVTHACHFPELDARDAGLCVEPSVAGITSGLRALLERSDSQRHSMGDLGRQLVEERYTWSQQATRLNEVYAWLAGGGSRPIAVEEADTARNSLTVALSDDQRMTKPQPPVGRARVSVIVPVKNEAENLRRCLPALQWADEIFVVDSHSSDETEAVAAQYNAQVVQFEFNGVYPKKKNWALENLKFANEWILIVDADEVVPPELAEEISRRTSSDEADGFYLNMKYFFLGRRIRHCGYSEAWNLRLFKHRLGRYERMPVSPGSSTGDNEAHEHVELAGRVAKLEHELDHFAYPSISVWVEKHNRYASWEAEMYERFLRETPPKGIGAGKRWKRRLKRIYLRLPMRPLVRFIYAYIFRLGFLDGLPGLAFCTLLGFYDFLCWAKVYERRIAAEVSARSAR